MKYLKKLYKRLNFVFLAMAVFFVSFIMSDKDSNNLSVVEKAKADAAPVFTAEQIASWIGRGGDAAADGGDTP